MTVNRGIKQKGFGMYIIGIPGARIAKLLGLKDSTVYKWIKTEEWEKNRQELENEREKNSNISTNEQDLKLIESVLGLWVEALRVNKSNLTDRMKPRDLHEAIKMRRLLKGESTENIAVNNEVMSVKEEVDKLLQKGEDE